MEIIIEALRAGYKSIKIQEYKDGEFSAYIEAKDSHMPDLEIYSESLPELEKRILEAVRD